MLFSYGVHTKRWKQKGISSAFYYSVTYLFWFLPPVFLVMIYEALYIKVLKYPPRLSVFITDMDSTSSSCLSPLGLHYDSTYSPNRNCSNISFLLLGDMAVTFTTLTLKNQHRQLSSKTAPEGSEVKKNSWTRQKSWWLKFRERKQRVKVSLYCQRDSESIRLLPSFKHLRQRFRQTRSKS